MYKENNTNMEGLDNPFTLFNSCHPFMLFLGAVEGWAFRKDISKENEQLKLDSFFVLGNGRRICLWEDCWCGEGALSVWFPTLYNLADPKGARVTDVWNDGMGEGAWNPSFIRPLNNWEVDEVQRFLILLCDRIFYQKEKDRRFRKGDKKGLYTVKANVALLEDNSERAAPRNMLWNSCVPPKVFLCVGSLVGESAYDDAP